VEDVQDEQVLVQGLDVAVSLQEGAQFVQGFACIMVAGIEKYGDACGIIRYNPFWREHRNLPLAVAAGPVGGFLYLVVVARSLMNVFRLARLIRTARPT
jgi:hypothetical protein